MSSKTRAYLYPVITRAIKVLCFIVIRLMALDAYVMFYFAVLGHVYKWAHDWAQAKSPLGQYSKIGLYYIRKQPCTRRPEGKEQRRLPSTFKIFWLNL